jgi:hypothetical protein
MLYTFTETVLIYDAALLTQWEGGDKSLLPNFVERRRSHGTQQEYHFPEAFALRHFHDTDGWKGFDDYVLMTETEPTKHLAGRRMLERVVPTVALRKLRLARSKSIDGQRGAGEPDLFLYKISAWRSTMLAARARRSAASSSVLAMCLTRWRETSRLPCWRPPCSRRPCRASSRARSSPVHPRPPR